jgi:hypothetical protein
MMVLAASDASASASIPGGGSKIVSTAPGAGFAAAAYFFRDAAGSCGETVGAFGSL